MTLVIVIYKPIEMLHILYDVNSILWKEKREKKRLINYRFCQEIDARPKC